MPTLPSSPSWSSVFIFGAFWNVAVEREFAIGGVLLLVALVLWPWKDRLMPKTETTIVISFEAEETTRLKALCERVGAEPSDVILQALQVYEYLVDEVGVKKTKFHIERAGHPIEPVQLFVGKVTG